ncbi:MAG TPA: hypothetical protein VLA52_00495 [Thermohalobaculum sp.]|nr:hypothetical protein [Thermohalobaculum sp.]
MLGGIVLGFLALHGKVLNHDTSWFIVATGWWLDGLPLYDEILELNPPLAFYLTAPPVAAARLLALDTTEVSVVYVLALTGVSLIWSLRLLAADPEITGLHRVGFAVFGSIALILLPLADFGQREHLLLVFVLPYLALGLTGPAAPPRPWWERALIGLWATFGLALKPVFLLIPLATTLAACACRRSAAAAFTVQNAAIVLACCAYLGAAWMLHPAYFDSVIPLARLTYGPGYDHPLLALAGLTIPTALVFLLSSAGLPFLGREALRPALILAAAGFAGAVIFFVQAKGWTYHSLPFKALAGLACGWIALSLRTYRGQFFLPLAQMLGFALFLMLPAIGNGTYANTVYRDFARYFTCPAGERSFQLLAAHVYHAYPLANYADAKPANRGSTLWPIPGAARQLQSPEGFAPERKLALEGAIDATRLRAQADFLREKPQLVFVDTRPDKPYFGGAEFDYLAFLLTTEAVIEAWKQYEKVGTYDGFDIYRRPGCAPPPPSN